MNDIFFKRKMVSGVQAHKKVSKSTHLVLEEAERNGIAWKKVPFTEAFSLTYQGVTKYFHGQIPSETTEFAYHCCKNKEVAKSMLSNAGLSVSAGFVVKPTDEAEYTAQIFEILRKPLVVKPTNDQQGNNVFVNITTSQMLSKSMEKIYSFNGDRKVDLLIEHMFSGNEYRILATQEKILSVIKRVPANVVGDGKSTIQVLIDLKNSDPIRLEMPTYNQIKIIKPLLRFLQLQALTLESVLPKGKKVFLLPHGPLDISQGGDTIDVTDTIHSSVSEIVRQAMVSFPGLSLAGIDFMTTDINARQTSESYTIIEINSSPSLDWNEFPIVGPRRRVTYEFLKIMFPQL